MEYMNSKALSDAETALKFALLIRRDYNRYLQLVHSDLTILYLLCCVLLEPG